MLPFYVSPLLKHTLHNLSSSLSEECANTCVSRSCRLTVKGCSQSGMPCFGSSLFVSFAGPRIPEACLSRPVSIGFPHACLSLRVDTGSDNVPKFLQQLDWSVDLDIEDKMLLDYDDSLRTMRSTKLSTVQVFDFPYWANCGDSPFSTHMSIHVLSTADETIEPLAFHRVIALLRTDRDHAQKLVLTRLCALPRSRPVACGVSGPSQSSRINNIPNIRFSVSLAHSQKSKT